MSKDLEESGGCAGLAVVVVVGSGVLAGIWAAAPNAAVLGLWGLGTGAVWWSVSRTANPAPPPAPEEAVETKQQFTAMDDETNPRRSRVVWDTKRKV